MLGNPGPSLMEGGCPELSFLGLPGVFFLDLGLPV